MHIYIKQGDFNIFTQIALLLVTKLHTGKIFLLVDYIKNRHQRGLTTRPSQLVRVIVSALLITVTGLSQNFDNWIQGLFKDL